MKHFFLVLISVFLMSAALALPGNYINQNDTSLVSACSIQNPETISSFSLESLGNLIGCQQYENDQYLEYCDCMGRVYGDSIEDHPEYENFKIAVETFDRQESRIEKFTNEAETAMLAALANYLATKVSGSSDPFAEGGVCTNRIELSQEGLNSHFEIPQEIDGLTTILNRTRDDNYLSANGVDDSSIDAVLSNFFSVSEVSGSHPSIQNNYGSSESNDILRLLGESVDSVRGPGSSLMQTTHEQAALLSNGASIGISAEVALSGVCENLAKRFESARSAQNSHPIPVGEFIDVGTYISSKYLNPADMNAFRGLKGRFQAKNILEADGQDLFFGQLMCSNIDRESFGEIEGTDDPSIKALENAELAERIKNNNAFIKETIEEYEAASDRLGALEQVRSGVESEINEILSRLGVSESRFKELYNSIESEADILGVVDEMLGATTLSSGEGLALLEKVTALYSTEPEYDEVFTAFTEQMNSIAQVQTYNNEIFRELASRVGGVTNTHEYIGAENLASDSVNYFERFHIDENLIGPVMPDRMRFENEGPGGVAEIIESNLLQRLRAEAAVATRIERPDMSRDEIATFVATAETTFSRTHSRQRIRDFIEGRSSVGNISGAPRRRGLRSSFSSNSNNTMSASRLLPENSPEVSFIRNLVSDNSKWDRTTNTSEVRNQALAAVAANSAIRATSDTPLGQPSSRPEEFSRSVSDFESAEEVSSEAADQISQLSDRVDREILAAQQNTEDQDPSRLNTLRRFESELAELKQKNERLKTELNSDVASPIGRAARQISPRSTRTGSRANNGNSTQSPVAIAAPTPQEGSSGTQRSVASRPNYDSINAQVDSALGLESPVEGSSLTSGSLQLSFRRVSSLSDNTEVESINENFLSLTDDQKLEYVEKFFAARGGREAYIKQEDGTVVFIQLEDKSTRNGRSIASVEDGSRLREEGSRVVTRVEQLSRLFSIHFEE